jgi:AcrR family transcriptional regulator
MNQTGSKTAPRRTQAERSQTTQRKIIKSAIRLLQKVGFQQTICREIARGAKVTLGAVQHQFGSRQALMEQVVDEIMAPLAAAGAGWPEDAAAAAGAARSRIRAQGLAKPLCPTQLCGDLEHVFRLQEHTAIRAHQRAPLPI